MTNPEPFAATSTPPARPGSVLAAAICFWLAALALATQVPQVIFDLATVTRVTRQAGARTGASPTEIRNEIGGARIFDAVTLLVLVVLVAALVLAAFGFLSGRDTARVMGMVAAGAVLLCCTLAVAGSVVGGHQPDANEFQRQVTQLQEAGTPGWIGWLSVAALAVYPLLIAGAVLLLAAPSRRFFRPFAGYYVYPMPPKDPVPPGEPPAGELR